MALLYKLYNVQRVPTKTSNNLRVKSVSRISEFVHIQCHRTDDFTSGGGGQAVRVTLGHHTTHMPMLRV